MALLNNIDEFKQHVGLNNSAEGDYFKQLQPDLLLAEDEHLRGTLGSFYDDFLAQLSGELSEEAERLRYLLQSSLANLTMLSYLDMAQVQISGSGVQIISNEREKTAFPWQIANLKTGYARKGFNGLDKVLAYLDQYPEQFPAWRSSPTAQAARGYFLTSAADFSAYYNISNARLSFLALASLLHKTETFALEPVIGTPFFDELKQQLRDDELRPANGLLLEKYLRPALAHLTMALAIGELGVSLNGAALELNIYRFDDSNNKEADADLTRLLQLKADQALKDGDRYLRRLRTHLNAEASEEKYATYFASSAYEAPEAEPYIRNQSTQPAFFAI
jgi:hypothetical protein